MMNLAQYSDLAEIIAAVSTVVALIYLAIQVRAATSAMKADSRRNEQYLPYATSIIENPDVARIFVAGLATKPHLSPEDSARFDFLFGQHLGIEAAYFDEVQFGIGSKEILGVRQVTLSSFLHSPGGKEFWRRHRASYAEGFRHYADKILETTNAP
jgi:hypothetical protein